MTKLQTRTLQIRPASGSILVGGDVIGEPRIVTYTNGNSRSAPKARRPIKKINAGPKTTRHP
jgi:hypothetical protein